MFFRVLISTFLSSALSFSIYAADSQPSAQSPQDLSQPSNLDFANGLFSRRMYGPAISEYEKFIQSNPSSEEVASARFRIADSYYFMRNYEEAIRHFGSFVKDFPEEKRRPVALFRLGASRFNLKDWKAADKIFIGLAGQAEDPNIKSGALFYMAKIDGARGRAGQERVLLDRILKGFPQTEYAVYASLMLGDSHAAEGKRDDAIAAYRIAVDRQMPAQIADEATYKIAELYYADKKFPEARSFYEKIYDKYKEAAKAEPQARDKKVSPFFDRALLGIFYVDYQLKNSEQAFKFLNDNPRFISQGSGRHEALYLVAALSADRNEHVQALEYLERILKDPEADIGVVEKSLFKKASILKITDRKEEALAELQKILGSKMKSAARAHFERAEILSEMGRLDEAALAYQASLEYEADDFSKAALYNLAGVNLKSGVKAQARNTFMAYVEKYPEEPDAQKAYLQAIQIELDLEHFQEAARSARGFIKRYPENEWLDVAYYKLGLALTGLGQYEEASQAFRTVVSRFPQSQLYPEAIYGTGASLENSGNTKGAIDFYEKLASDYPDHALSKKALPHLAFLYIQDNNFEKAAALYEDILLNKPDVSVSPKTAFWLIQYRLDHSHYEAMQKVLDVLPKRFPQENLSHAVNFFIGESFMGLKDTAKAAEFYDKSIEADPNGDFVAHALLGSGVAYLVRDNIKDAEVQFARALRYDHEVDVALRARFEIANIKLKVGNIPEAAKAFMMVAVLYEDDKYCPVALYKAGECFRQLNQPEEAQKAFDELKTRYPKSEWAKKAPVETTGT